MVLPQERDAEEKMIKSWSIIISGFTQTENRLHGCMGLWRSMMPLNQPDSIVIQPPWDYNWEHLAERIRLTSVPGVRVNIYAYSWGCGNGMVNLALELRKRAIMVSHAVLSDPVVYSSWPTWTAKFLTVFLRKSIDIPSNVRRVDWFRQVNGLPYGCDLVPAKNSTTEIREPVILDLPHEAMDDAPEWHQRCLEVAGLREPA